MATIQDFDGPIPGENYTSDTKNYPWHREPDITDLDEGIEYTINKLSKKEAAFGLMTMLEMGLPITVAARTFVLSGLGEGRWTPDFAVLLAGPVARVMLTMAKAYGVKPTMGFDNSGPPTKAFLEFSSRVNEAKLPEAIEAVDMEVIQQEAAKKLDKPSSKGFMTRPEKSPTEEME